MSYLHLSRIRIRAANALAGNYTVNAAPIMAIVLFAIIKAMNAARTLGGKRKRGEPEAPAAPTEKTCPYCKSKIAVDATRCPYCTSEVD